MDIFRGAAASACFLGIIFSALSGIVPDEKFSRQINIIFSLVAVLIAVAPFVGADISLDEPSFDESVSSDYEEIYSEELDKAIQSELCARLEELLSENSITAVKISADVNNFSDGSISIIKVTVSISDKSQRDKTERLLREVLGDETETEVTVI